MSVTVTVMSPLNNNCKGFITVTSSLYGSMDMKTDNSFQFYSTEYWEMKRWISHNLLIHCYFIMYRGRVQKKHTGIFPSDARTMELSDSKTPAGGTSISSVNSIIGDG